MDSHPIVWDARLALGDQRIDAQHRRLVELIGALPAGAGSPDPSVLDEVLDYAASHFAAEEAFMERVGYPDRAVHARKHRTLGRMLQVHRQRFEAGQDDLYAFQHFMYRWVRDHIMDEDSKIGVFLRERREHGVERAS